MGYRILIVDDSSISRITIREILESLGHQIVGEADSGRGGIDAYRTLRPDLMTLDISLPDMDGIQVLRELRLKIPTVKVILISGNDQKKVQDQARLLRAPLVCKPFSVETLANAVAQAAGPVSGSPKPR